MSDKDTADLARCIREQAHAAAYLRGEIPPDVAAVYGDKDRDGAWRGLLDWLMEESIIRLESRGGGR